MDEHLLVDSQNQKKSRTKTESSSESTSSDETSINSEAPAAPDGGWGWMVVLGSFLCHLFADGFAFSFGVLYKDFLTYFGDTKSNTSWIGSLFFGISMMLGPFAGFLTSKYGCRKVTIAGGIITAFGFLLSAFMNSVSQLCLTFGCIAGFGLSLIYIPAIVVVAFYFERQRAFATGLAVCGSGIGTFAIAPLTEYLLEKYSWRGVMFIWAGLALNLVVCGSLFRPLKFSEEEKFKKGLDTFEKMSKTKSRLSLEDMKAHNTFAEQSTEKLHHQVQSVMQLPTYFQNHCDPVTSEKILNEIRNNNTSVKQLLSEFFSTHSVSDHFNQNGPVSDCLSSSDFVINKPTNNKTQVIWKRQRTAHMRRKAKAIANLYTEPMKREDIFYRGNLFKKPSISCRALSCPDLHLNVFPSKSSDSTKASCDSRRILHGVYKVFKQMMDMDVVKNPLFLLFTLSSFILYFWCDVPYVFLVDKAIRDGTSEKEASFLISIAGIVNTVGQILYGFLGDRPNINNITLYAVSTVLCGASVAVIPFITTYIPLALMSACYGLFISANYSLSTILLVQFVGMNKLTSSYGLLMMNLGIANLIGPPVAGFLFDISNTYDYSFIFAGLSIVLSGVLVFFCPLVTWMVEHDIKCCCIKQLSEQSHPSITPNINGNISSKKNTLVVIERETVV